MSDTIPIVPYAINIEIDHIRIFVDNFKLNEVDCWCSVYEYDASDKLLNVHRVYIEPEVYEHWGVNDKYLEDVVIDKLGYERKPDIPIILP